MADSQNATGSSYPTTSTDTREQPPEPLNQVDSKATKAAKTTSKKKKRRNNKKKEKCTTTESNGPVQVPEPEDNHQQSGAKPNLTVNSDQVEQMTPKQPAHGVPMSPRRQTIMRYKKSDDAMNNGLINGLKDTLKSNTSNASTEPTPELKRASMHVDEKLTLFKYKSSKILVFDEGRDPSQDQQSPGTGRLLGHGEFEIFQLHNGDVTYLSCGPSFIYPLLPKLKALRVDFNQFVLPLVNPDRYWKIFINTDDVDVVEQLEAVLESTVSYRNLAIGAKPPITHVSKFIPATIPESVVTDRISFNLDQISSEIPDSPPSAPLSPNQNPQVISTYQLGSPLRPMAHNDLAPPPALSTLPRDNSSKSISSAMASLDVPGALSTAGTSATPKLYHTKPKKLFGSYLNHNNTEAKGVNGSAPDTKSDSSMDSLLDEYEESMSVSKSFTYSKSRPMSRSSSFIQPSTYQYQLHSPRMHAELEHDDFPTTSLTNYNRIHNQTRSRRSSRSELYVPETNWMDPDRGNPPPIIPKSGHHLSQSRAYSVASGQEYGTNDLGTTYRQIYKSITQRNLASFVNDKSDSRSVRSSQARLPTIEQSRALRTRSSATNTSAISVRDDGISGVASNNSRRSRSTSTSRNSAQPTKLKADDVYKLLHEKPAAEPKKGIASRLFGW